MKRELDFEKKNFAGGLEIVKTLSEKGHEAFFVGGLRA